MNPFEPNTYGYRYFESLRGMSYENLARRQAQLEGQLTYAVDDECRRMVALQCVGEMLAQAENVAVRMRREAALDRL